ncbi:MAG: BTAD domain-containing putative transcriptional regulator, partial [Fimbriimonadales bacterium]
MRYKNVHIMRVHARQQRNCLGREDPAEGARHMTPFEVSLFGPMSVLVYGQPIPRLRTRKGLWLLAILTLRAGRQVERSWLAGTLWPEHDDVHGLRSLRQSLHDLRLALGPESWRLSSDSPRSLGFDATGVAVDATRFDSLIDEGDLEAAIRLYRGPLLEGCGEEWVTDERRRREQAYVSALEAMAHQAMGVGDYSQAACWLRQAVAADPYREDLQCALMEALDAGGDAVGALAVYRDLRTLLWRELAVAPSDEVSAMHRRIREGARRPVASGSPPRTVPPSPTRIPKPLTNLIGREGAVAEVRALLRRSRLITLTGTGGIGKTRVALQVALEENAGFDDGSSFVSLASLRDGARVLDEVCEALAIPPPAAPSAEPLGRLIQHLAKRSALLVLDNCEHVATECAALVQTLLEQCPDLSVLTTSRQALLVRGETVLRVPPLSLPTDADGGDSLAHAAVQLFVERARAAEASFRISPSNSEAVVGICKHLDGIPLAIELAAARVRSLPLDEVIDQLQVG